MHLSTQVKLNHHANMLVHRLDANVGETCSVVLVAKISKSLYTHFLSKACQLGYSLALQFTVVKTSLANIFSQWSVKKRIA